MIRSQIRKKFPNVEFSFNLITLLEYCVYENMMTIALYTSPSIHNWCMYDFLVSFQSIRDIQGKVEYFLNVVLNSSHLITFGKMSIQTI